MFGRKRSSLYANICKALDKLGIKYSAEEEDKAVFFNIQGDDLPIAVALNANDETNSMFIFEKLMFDVPPAENTNIAVAINRINTDLPFGSFHLDTDVGSLFFKYSWIFTGQSPPEPERIAGIVKLAIDTVDEHDGDLKELMDSSWKRSEMPIYQRRPPRMFFYGFAVPARMEGDADMSRGCRKGSNKDLVLDLLAVAAVAAAAVFIWCF